MKVYYLLRTDGAVFTGKQSLRFWRKDVVPAYYTDPAYARRLAREMRQIGNDCDVEEAEVDDPTSDTPHR